MFIIDARTQHKWRAAKKGNTISIAGGTMKNKKVIIAVILGTALALIYTSCGPFGGTITLVNDSSYPLTNAKISLGNSQVDRLNPGQRMSASVDKNIFGANVIFTCIIPDTSNPLNMDLARDKLVITGCGQGGWGLGIYTSPLVSLNDGERVTITVKNKPPAPLLP